MTATESGVTGPLFADVHYPIATPSLVISATTVAANVYDTFPLEGRKCSPAPEGTAISLGDWDAPRDTESTGNTRYRPRLMGTG